ncbi:hypothetical protein K439DRAFT_1631168 [Ramaria rubella]|nr:hypothetical protein K439DRAFT_1631168 [Ramaria rubella]
MSLASSKGIRNNYRRHKHAGKSWPILESSKNAPCCLIHPPLLQASVFRRLTAGFPELKMKMTPKSIIVPVSCKSANDKNRLKKRKTPLRMIGSRLPNVVNTIWIRSRMNKKNPPVKCTFSIATQPHSHFHSDIDIEDTFTSRHIDLPKPRPSRAQASTPRSLPFQPVENLQHPSAHALSAPSAPSASVHSTTSSLCHAGSSSSPATFTHSRERASSALAQPRIATSGSPRLSLQPQAVIPIYASGSGNHSAPSFSTTSSPEPTSSSSNDPPHKAQKRTLGDVTSRRTKRPIAGDFVDKVESTILLAARYYRVLLCTGHAFPLELDSDLYAKQAWQLACQEHENHTLATPDVYKVLRQRGSQVRGELKRVIQPLVTAHYHLETSADAADTANTMALISRIKANNTLVYKDHEKRTGLFETPILLAAIKTQWFSHTQAEGVNFHMYFNPIPTPVMALIFTVIENCLDEWKSGQFKAIPFQEKCYREIFQEHLTSLDKWQNHAQGGPILARWQTLLHEKARLHSGAGPLETTRPSRITDSNFEAAVREAGFDVETRSERSGVRNPNYGNLNDESY